MDILDIERLNIIYKNKYSEKHCVKDFNMHLRKGEIVSILGESGSGKSTIVKSIVGLLPTSTRVRGILKLDTNKFELSDKNIKWNNIRSKNIGMIFQDSHQSLNPMLKIKSHFKETLKDFSEKEVREIGTKYLKLLNFDDINRVLDSYPFQLSGGMAQRVCIALSLCLNPKIIIADEITSSLDVISQIEVIKILKSIRDKLDISIIFITHDISVSKVISDRIIVLKDGVIQDQGTVEHIFETSSGYTRRLIKSREDIGKLKSINEDIGKDILIIENLSKTYEKDTKLILENISISLRKNEILGILGESGCGKSTLSKCIIGLEKINSGKIIFDDTDLTKLSKYKRRMYAKRIQMIFQNGRDSLNPRRKVIDLVIEPLKYLKLYSKEERIEKAKEVLSEVKIDSELFNRKPGQLSTGQCQRVAIARAIIVKPEILICDEPVSSLDMTLQSQILKLFKDIKSKYNISFILVSHDILVVKNLCNRIAVMNQGEFCDIIETDLSKSNTYSEYAKKLLDMEKLSKIKEQLV